MSNQNPNELSLNNAGIQFKFKPKPFFQAVFTGRLLGSMGSSTGVAKQGASATMQLLPKDNKEKRAFNLVYNGLVRACVAIVKNRKLENTISLAEKQIRNAQIERVMKEMDIKLTPAFFQHPDQLAFLQDFEVVLADWLVDATQNLDFPISKLKAKGIASQLKPQFGLSIVAEWRTQTDYYQPVFDFFNHPFKDSIEERFARLAYYDKVQLAYLSPVFGDVDNSGMRLQDIYIEPHFRVFKKCYPSEFDFLKENERHPDRTAFGHDKAHAFRLTIHQFVDGFLRGECSLPHLQCEDARMMIILGQPGQGKTSFCYRLVYDLLNRTEGISQDFYLIKLRAVRNIDNLIKDPLNHLQDFVENNLLHHPVTKRAFRKSLLILDGLDELYMKEGMKAADIDDFCKELSRLSKNHPDLKVIITSRHNYIGLDRLKPQDFFILQLNEFSLQQQKQWLQRYRQFHTSLRFDEANLDKINNKNNDNFRHLRELVNQPILLHMIATADFEIEDNANRAAIYDSLFAKLSNRDWAKKEGQLEVLENIDPDDLRDFIRAIAVKIYQSDFEYIRNVDLDKIPEVKDFKANLNVTGAQELDDALRSMMIAFHFQPAEREEQERQQSKDNSRYAFEFLHKSLQEFLVAEKIWLTAKSLLDKDQRGRKFTLKTHDAVLKSFSEDLAAKELSKEVTEYLIELIRNDTTTDKLALSKRMADFLPDLVDCDFLYEFDCRQHSLPMNLSTNTFHGYWTVLSHLVDDDKQVNKADKNFINEHLKNRFCVLLKNTQSIKWRFFNLSYQDLNEANLDRARLDWARLDWARLVGASLDRARLDWARLDGARLDWARLDGASLDGASLDGASLYGASLVEARLDGARLDGARLTATTGLTATQLKKAASLYRCIGLAPHLEKEVRKTHQHLFEKPR